jgi:protease-4
MSEPAHPPHGAAGDDELRERQGTGPAALFLRAARRRVLGVGLAVGATLSRWFGRRRPYRVLRIELGGDLPELPRELRLRDLGRRSSALDLLTLLATLRSAREDPELRMVVLDVHGLDAGWATIQSVRRALLALAASGKPVWAYLTQPGTRDYYLASAASRVLLAPAGIFDVTGLASEVVFVKGALDKLGIEAQLARAGRFKAAAEPFTRTDMSPEHRAMAEGLLDDLYEQLVADVAAARHMSAETVRAAFAEGPLLAAEAVRRGFVDALAYPDELRRALEDRCGDRPPIELGAYRRRRAWTARRAALDAPTVGVLVVSGTIGGETLPGSRARTTTWRGFRRELATMADDARLAGIVLRIDSPGGSGLASDLMWREIVQTRKRKPVLVSMGDVAASGGYYLAAGADHITAEAATLTGSIGVLAGKPVLRGLYEHLGIKKELVVRGNAGRHSDYLPLDDENLRRLRGEAEAFYAEFVAKVAAGRGLSAAAVEGVAEGRVWTGRQAMARGLVDALGGIEETLGEMRRRLGIRPESRLAFVRRPRAGAVWRSALAGLVPRDVVTEVLGMLAPMLHGERLLAVMPFLVRFVPDGAVASSDGGAGDPATVLFAAAPPPIADLLRTVARAAAESIAGRFRSPLVF